MAVIGFLPSSTHRFTSNFAGIPVVIKYEVEVREDHRGADIDVIPLICVIAGHEVELCENAGFFHLEQLKTWLAEAEADYENIGADDGEPVDHTDSAWAAAAAEDQWIAQRDHAHYAHAGL
jgi:hypothetical protein